jgi:hypothetical protein
MISWSHINLGRRYQCGKLLCCKRTGLGRELRQHHRRGAAGAENFEKLAAADSAWTAAVAATG